LEIYKEYRAFYQKKLSLRFQKYRFGIRDPTRDAKITYSGSRGSGVKKTPETGSGSATLLIYTKKPDLIKQELGGKVVLLGERGDGEGAALLRPLVIKKA
jgi:hypothetical protein